MQAVDGLDRRRRIEEGRIRQRSLGDVDEHPQAVRHVLFERPLEAQNDELGDVVAEPRGRTTVHAQEWRPRCRELAEGRHQLERAAGVASPFHEAIEVDVADDARDRCGDNRDSVRRVRLLVGRRIEDVQLLACVVADELDQRRDAERAADVVHVQHEHGDRGEHEQECDDDRKPRNGAASVAAHADVTRGQHRMRERGDEDADRELTRPIAQDPLHDARRELPHGQLHDDHRDREHEGREAHHGRRGRRENHQRGIRTPRESLRNQLVVETIVHPERRERDRDAREDTGDGNEPEARPDVVGQPERRDLPQRHRPTVPLDGLSQAARSRQGRARRSEV